MSLYKNESFKKWSTWVMSIKKLFFFFKNENHIQSIEWLSLFLDILILNNTKHRQNVESFFLAWAVWGKNFLYVSRGYSLSTSIPMNCLSNRCNWCSIPKRRKRNSQSGFFWSDQKKNLFKYSCYSLYPSKRCSTH